VLVPRKYSIAEARNSLPKLVKEAEAGREVSLTRRGRPVAVLVGQIDYERLASGPRNFWNTYQDFRREVDLPALAIDPEAVFGPARDRSKGRDVAL
jgi:prevent-host-death family protein